MYVYQIPLYTYRDTYIDGVIIFGRTAYFSAPPTAGVAHMHTSTSRAMASGNLIYHELEKLHADRKEKTCPAETT